MRRILLTKLTLIFCLFLSIKQLKAQDNYEIQVYGSETIEKGKTMLEIHSNFTLKGSQSVSNGEFPTNHVEHETIEITHGWTPGLKPDSTSLTQ
ncbi:hypothetical protein [Mucilaginibacter endophyticus]|uniref:hypothetical protein n=1 Tax=Mucilaginibacter endophyticus TaxID=2675003 RepID=UPI001ABFA2B7|nr:hypothetical protein [Mucilaginibacter endophyticus]